MNNQYKNIARAKQNDFVINISCEPPKFYFDELERSRIVELVMYKTVIHSTEILNGENRENEIN